MATLKLFEVATYTSLSAARRQQGGLGFIEESSGFAAHSKECQDLIRHHSVRPHHGLDAGFKVGWHATSSLFVLFDTENRADRTSRSEFEAQLFTRPGRWTGSMVALGALVVLRLASGKRLAELIDDEAESKLEQPDDETGWLDPPDLPGLCAAVCGLAESRLAELRMPLAQAGSSLSVMLSLMTSASAAEVSASVTGSDDPERATLELRCIDRTSDPVTLPSTAAAHLEICAADARRWSLLQQARRQLTDWPDWAAAVELVAIGGDLDDFLRGMHANGPSRAERGYRASIPTPPPPPALPPPSPSVDHARVIDHALAANDSRTASEQLRQAQAQRLGWKVLVDLDVRGKSHSTSFDYLADENVLQLAVDMDASRRAYQLLDLLPTDVLQLARLAEEDHTRLLAARLCALAPVSSANSLANALRYLSDSVLEEGLWALASKPLEIGFVRDIVLAVCLYRQSPLPLEWAWNRRWMAREELREVVDELARATRPAVAREFLRSNLRTYLQAAGIAPDVVHLIEDVVKVKQRSVLTRWGGGTRE